MTEEIQKIACGCLFTVTGPDAEANLEAYQEHLEICPNRPPVADQSWWDVLVENVFSFWGWVVIATIGVIIVAAVTGRPLWN